MQLETERMYLRHLQDADAPYLTEMDSDPEVMRYITVTHTPPTSEEPARAWIAAQNTKYSDTPYGVFTATLKSTGEFIGWFLLRDARDHRLADDAGFHENELELGYRFLRRFWGQGLGTEGAQALVEHARAQGDYPVIVAIALSENRASTRVMEKAGMTFDGECALPGYALPASRYRLEF